MKIISTLLLFFTSTLLFAQQTQSITINSGGVDRDFFLYVPDIYDDNSPAPLVFCLHGYGSSASANISYTGFRPVADTAGFLESVNDETAKLPTSPSNAEYVIVKAPLPLSSKLLPEAML